MTDAKRDNNSITTLIGVSSADGITPVVIYVDPVTHRILVNSTGGATPGGSNTQVQYNNNGALGGITGATTDGTKLTLVAPVLGAALATSINGLTITSTSGGVLTIANSKTLTISNTLTFTGTDSSSVAFGAGGTVAYVANKLSVFAATTSAELAGVISDETGSGLLVFNNAPTFIAPVLGAATATSINGLIITTTTGTFTLANGKTFTVNNTLTLAGVDGKTLTFNKTMTITSADDTGVYTLPTGTKTIPSTADKLSVFAATSSSELAGVISDETGSGALVFGTNPTIAKPVINARNQTAQTYSPAGAGTATLDLSLGDQHYITMPAGNITIALSNDTNNQIFYVTITQDSTGSRTVTWFTTIKWAGGSAPTLTTTANKRDAFIFVRTGSGTYDGFIVGQNI